MGSTSQAITNGTIDLDTPPRNATLLFLKAGGGYCTGSLITSDLALTARHCNIMSGDTVWFGAENGAATSFTPTARARRTVDGVSPATTAPVPNDASLALRAQDVAIVRIKPPITMQASPQRPSLLRPPLLPLVPPFVAAATIDGGFSGYGQRAILAPDGGIEPTIPQHRQAATSANLQLAHIEFASGFAVWLYTAHEDINEGDPQTGLGDSGGPLFRSLPEDARDVIGVASGIHTTNYSPCPDSICGEPLATDVYADITAPAMQAFIKSVVDPNNDERWEGQVDYVRTQEGTPGSKGCDVAPGPDCDPGCVGSTDPDCDLIVNGHDNCAHDYNPDQRNSDDPGNPVDPSMKDPGDACDLCPLDPIGVDNGSNCNSDAEVLSFGGPRPHLLENDVVGDPLAPFLSDFNPNESDQVLKVRGAFQGDACDYAPCTELGAQSVNLEPAIYGQPDPTGPACSFFESYLNGSCVFRANAQIQHDGRWHAGFGATGNAGYRFCKCNGPFTTQEDRLNNCFNDPTGASCPWHANDFLTPGKLNTLTVTPAFGAIPGTSGPEVGTADAFTDTPKTDPPSFRWRFENDICPITKFCPNPGLPLDDANAAGINITGLTWSNVRALSATLPPLYADLESQWLPTKLTVGYGFEGGHWGQSSASGGWGWGCPDCPFGLETPWQLITSPVLPAAFGGITAKGVVDITELVDPAALSLLRTVTATSGRALIPAAEHKSWLADRAAPFAPRWVVADLQNLTFLGAIGQDVSGHLLPVRGRAVGTASSGGAAGAALTKPTSPAMQPCWETGSVACPHAGGDGVAVASVSAVRQALYVLERAPGDVTRLHVFDVLSETWSETTLTGPVLPEAPLAMTYHAQVDALFLVDRSGGSNGSVRLFRVGLDGHVTLLAQGFGLSHDHANVALSASERGTLLLSATRAHPVRFGLVEIDVSGKHGSIVGGYRNKVELRAPPFLTNRALHILVNDANGDPKALEIDPKSLRPPHANHDHNFD